ncbi:MAG: (2E,6E)-farnesyl diphosphate synthase [Gammaproteobacteria bacterium]|nr:(2E,6E)-farnesyl diphosphate synthase [Gammaproteobacteria bacterium]MDH3768949.1 (2E,6E)-farnesyl diphosphate synthase [Gammaproteobacteria bacterium]
MAPLREFLGKYRIRVDEALERWLPDSNLPPSRLHEAMRYITLGGGKRLRPVLVYATGCAAGLDEARLDGPACAVELIHTYSLVHDDLPAMDNDDLRRGQPTCHRAYDEATAVLVGDALQVLAFEILARDESMAVAAELRIRMIAELAAASGTRGMAGGQAIDLAAIGNILNIEQLENMHRMKTGALISASVRMGAMAAADMPAAKLVALSDYADRIGLAFQIRDDILDDEGDAKVIGKTPGSDRASAKPTYTSMLGVDEAKKRAQQLHKEAIDSLSGFDATADTLRAISEYIVQRKS